ncbi:MAG: hypothetical protein ACXWG1_07740 [Usitatibacter sp.]
MRPQVLHALLLAAAAFCAHDAGAQAAVPSGATALQTGPGWGVATTTTIVSAQVVAIDAPTRRMDVQLADGRVVGLALGRDVRRVDEIRPGDVVNVAYVDSLMLALRKSGAGLVARSDSTGDVRRAPSSQPPSAVSQSEVTVLADVTAVDPASRTVTLRGPNRTVSVRLNDPRQIELVKVGDQVEATYTEAVAVSVEPAR